MPGYVALVTIHLHFGEVHDLKAKRKQLKSFTEQLRGRVGVAVAEGDHQDKIGRKVTGEIGKGHPESGFVIAKELEVLKNLR